MLNQTFQVPAKLKTTSLVLLVVGLISLGAGVATLLMSHDVMDQTRFWAVLLQNSLFFLLISLASVFILSATSLAQAAWIVSFRRIPEAIGSIVWILGIIAGAIMLTLVWTDNFHIYHWLEKGNIPHNSLNTLKNFFAMHGDIFGSVDTNSHLIAFDAQHSDSYVLAYHQGFSDAAG